ncbi:hypothetical protein PV797_01695 [Clostridiaceae bacterium M8S5]|nr:hypothetical protein PV797_01695 [Clostridiaceae bacterium M8S5]
MSTQNNDIINEAKFIFSLDNKSVPFKKRAEAINIPKEKIIDISTTGLLDIIMEYPFLANIFAYDDFDTGLDSLINIFEPLSVFISRPDAMHVLETKYTNIKEIDDKFIEKVFLEALNDRIGTKESIKDPLVGIKTTYVTTPRGTNVKVYIVKKDYTDLQKMQINNKYDRLYPNAQRLASATKIYNCHSYAWYEQSASNKYWMNDPTAYYTDGSYSQSSSVSSSVKATYMPTDDIKAQPEHSAIVSGDYFISKWGRAGLYKHRPEYSPYDSATIYYFKRT